MSLSIPRTDGLIEVKTGFGVFMCYEGLKLNNNIMKVSRNTFLVVHKPHLREVLVGHFVLPI